MPLEKKTSSSSLFKYIPRVISDKSHSSNGKLLFFTTSPTMVRLIYRLLRAFNYLASTPPASLRAAMHNTTLLRNQIMADLNKPLSYTLPLTGNAMSPIFNSTVSDMKTTKERLIIRRLSGAAQTYLNRIHVGDLVVIRDPHDDRRKYVRRVSGLEGAHMASRLGDAPFSIPAQHCWVVRENGSVEAPDSRSFGPLALNYIIGRVMYAIRSATDHGQVVNSPYAMACDSIVLSQEPVSEHIMSCPSDTPKDA